MLIDLKISKFWWKNPRKTKVNHQSLELPSRWALWVTMKLISLKNHFHSLNYRIILSTRARFLLYSDNPKQLLQTNINLKYHHLKPKKKGLWKINSIARVGRKARPSKKKRKKKYREARARVWVRVENWIVLWATVITPTYIHLFQDQSQEHRIMRVWIWEKPTSKRRIKEVSMLLGRNLSLIVARYRCMRDVKKDLIFRVVLGTWERKMNLVRIKS